MKKLFVVAVMIILVLMCGNVFVVEAHYIKFDFDKLFSRTSPSDDKVGQENKKSKEVVAVKAKAGVAGKKMTANPQKRFSTGVGRTKRNSIKKSPANALALSKLKPSSVPNIAVAISSSQISGASNMLSIVPKSDDVVPKLPEIVRMSAEFQNSPLADTYQLGSISLSIPSFCTKSDTFVVFINNSSLQIYYSLEELMPLCSGRVIKEGTSTKYIFNPQTSMSVDKNKNTVLINDNGKITSCALSGGNSLFFDNQTFVTSEILGNIFSIDSSLEALQAVFSPNFLGMKQALATHNMALENYYSRQTEEKKESGNTTVVKPAMFGLGKLQLYYSALSKAQGSLNYTYYAPLLGGTFQGSGTTNQPPFFSSAYLQYNYRDNTILAIGKNIYTAQYTYSPVYGNFNGIYYGKTSIYYVGYGSIDISGQASTGERVELYRSNVLLAFQYAQNGAYNFSDIKLATGNDVFVVKVYNEDGTYTEQATSVYSAIGFLKEGKSSVTASLGQVNYNNANSQAHTLEYTYGVTNDLTASLSQSQGSSTNDIGTALYYKNDYLVPNYTIAQYSLFSNNLSRASWNQYLYLTKSIQLNYGYLYSNFVPASVANTTLYWQNGGLSYNLSFVGNYVGAQNYAETFSAGQTLFGTLNNTTTVGLTQQLGGQNGTTLGEQIMYSFFNNFNLIGGATYYSTTKSTSNNVQLLYSTPNYSCSVQYSMDNQHNQVSTVGFSMPIGFGLLDSFGASASSNATQALSANKTLILSHPLVSSNGSVSNGWIYGHVQNVDGTPYAGGTISFNGIPVPVDQNGNYFAANIPSNSRVKIDSSQISADNHYGLSKGVEYVKVPQAQGVEMDYKLEKIRNLFGTIQAPSNIMNAIQVELLENGKVIKTSKLDFSGEYKFNRLVNAQYLLKVVVPKGYGVQNQDSLIQFSQNTDWIVIENPIIVQKEE